MSTGMTDNNQPPQTPDSNPPNVRLLEGQVMANIQASIARLEVKIDNLETNLEKHDVKLDKIGEDVDKLRSWRTAIIAGFAVATLLISSTIGFLGWGFNKAIDLYFSQPQAAETTTPPQSTLPPKK